MEAKWLEDFVSLAETRSFSRSAQLRNVTQPAFSRRIQALESWLGVDLVDRTSYPTRLTVPGETFYQQALEILGQINATRSMLRGDERVARDTIEFAMPHTMALTFFPKWLTQLRPQFGRLSTRLMALNVHDAVLRLVEGGCDLLLVYHHPRQPVQLDPNRYEMLMLGYERVAPYSRCDRTGEPQYKLPGSKGHPIPFLSYTPNAYLGRMVDVIMSESNDTLYLDKCYETDMSEALKVMVMEGHGVAFLPESSVAREVRSRTVAPAGPQWGLSMEVRLYRERSDHNKDTGANKKLVNQLWEHLQQRYDQRKLATQAQTMQKTHTRMRK